MVGQVRLNYITDYLGRFSVLFAGRILGALALFCVNLLIVNYLGENALADYAVFTSLVNVLAISLFFGFNSVGSIFAAEYQISGNRDLLKGFALKALHNGLLSSGILLMGISVLWLFSVEYVDDSRLFYFAIVLLTAGGTAVLGLNGAIQIGLKRTAVGQLPETLLRPVFLLTGTAVLLLSQLASGVSAIFMMACTAVWLALTAIFFLDADFLRDYRSIVSRTETTRWNRAAWPWMGTSLLWDYMIDIVILIASLMAGSVELAVLHVAFRYRILAGFGMRTIYALFLPEITENSTKNLKATVQRKLRLCNLASLAYSICVMICFIVFGKWLFQLFSLEAGLGMPILLVVSATMLARAIFGPAPLILAINNSHLVTLASSFVGFVFAAAWLWFFYPAMGIMAAAIGYSGANLFVSGFLWVYTWRKTGINCSLFG